jgi:hypothetical protein
MSLKKAVVHIYNINGAYLLQSNYKGQHLFVMESQWLQWMSIYNCCSNNEGATPMIQDWLAM